MKIDWRTKLSSRKLWALIASVVVSVGVIIGADGVVLTEVAGLIGTIGATVAYILGESIVDASRNKE